MQFKASIDYGLRAVLFLASKDSTCSSKDIAETMAIPRDYLIQLAQLLRRKGIIEARPGKHGGYRLARKPSEISLLDVIGALEDDAKKPQRAAADKDLPEAAVRIRSAYETVMTCYDQFMGSISLDMLLKCARDPSHSKEFIAEQLKAESDRLGNAVTGTAGR